MIVVIGSPIGRLSDGAIAAAGMASRVAISAAATGHTVQMVGRIGDDPTADGVVLDLARGGVGHVALLRDATRPTPLEPPEPDLTETDERNAGGLAVGMRPDELETEVGEPPGDDAPFLAGVQALEAADVDLGLRYLTEFSVVVVVAEPLDPAIVAVVAEAARWGDARMILIVPAGEGIPAGLPDDAVVFEAPGSDPDGVFATMAGEFAGRLDDGAEPGVAFRASLGSDGWTAAGQD